MTIRVISPPAPFVVPGDIPGSHAADDPAVKRAIAAATERLDGYTGSLGRCLAPQLLEYSGWLDCQRFTLPIGPVLDVASIVFESEDEAEIEVPSSGFRLRGEDIWVAPGAVWIRGRAHRVRYWAGYGRRDPAAPGTWIETVPARVKDAVILMAQYRLAAGAENLFLRSEAVEGVGTTTYTVSDQAGSLVNTAVDKLLAGLKVPRL